MARQSEELTTKETRQLEAFEQTIAEGWETFIKVGAALKAIRDQKLYRAAHIRKSLAALCARASSRNYNLI